MRPSGVFDEAGALSFFTILVVCLNELGDGGRKRSLLLLCLGLITLSMAHVFCFVAYSVIVFKKRIMFVVLSFLIVLGATGDFINEDSLLSLNFFRRFSVGETGQLVGDNRSNQVIEFFSLVDYDISRYGNNVMIKDYGHEVLNSDQSSNPFSIWFGYGFVMWLPYALTLVILFLSVLGQSESVKITSTLMLLLLLQRPYIYSLYWGFGIWSVIILMFIRKNRIVEDGKNII
jgi:hypothetical protein